MKNDKELFAEMIIAFCRDRQECAGCPARIPCDDINGGRGFNFTTSHIIQLMDDDGEASQ